MIFYGGSFAAPAASDFLDGQKVTKEPPGGGRNRQKRLRRSCLHAALPLEPHYGRRVPAKLSKISRRAKSERLSAVPSGPLGPGFAKIAAAAAPQPRLALPNQRLRRGFRRRGGCPHPPAPEMFCFTRWKIAVQESTLIRHGFAVPLCPFGTFPPDRGSRPSPLEGEGSGGRLIAAPTVHRKPVGAHSMCPPGFAPGVQATARAAPTADMFAAVLFS